MDVATVALNYVCLDYLGGQSLAQRRGALPKARAAERAQPWWRRQRRARLA
jgi:hypothetical protein